MKSGAWMAEWMAEWCWFMGIDEVISLYRVCVMELVESAVGGYSLLLCILKVNTNNSDYFLPFVGKEYY